MKNAYLATVGDDSGLLACAAHIPPSKAVITRANREPIVALANDVFEAVPQLDGVTGPSRSADDFAMAWEKLSGIAPTLGGVRIHFVYTPRELRGKGYGTAFTQDLQADWILAGVGRVDTT